MAKLKTNSIDYLISRLNEIYYSSFVDTDYDREPRNENDNYYSSKIINEKITSIDFDYFINEYTRTLPTFIQYIVDRLFRVYKFYDKNNWELTIDRGYYGDEFVSPSFPKIYDIISNLYAIKPLSDIEQIKYILNLEYGYILPILQDKTTATIISISPNEITSMNDHYFKKVNTEDQSIYNKYTLPRAICINSNNSYRIIDGYHRTISAIHNNLNQIDIILLS